MLQLCVVFPTFIFLQIQLAYSCKNGDALLVAGSSEVPLEGRVEICSNGRWGTVCDTQWDENDAAVVCRQLGFPSGSMVLPRNYMSGIIGHGRSLISLHNVTCTGDELMLSQCNSSSVPLCDHSNDVGVRCSYEGPPILVFNGKRYPNNSIIALQDIGRGVYTYNASLYCLTTLPQCCSGPETAAWHIPEGLDLSVHRNYEYYGPPTQTVNLYRPKSSYISGIFYCSILNNHSIPVFLYIGIYHRGMIIGKPSILSLTYDRGTHTSSCLSTGGPATTVRWSKDYSLLNISGTVYEQSQIILNTGLATYDNKLTIKSSDHIYGLYKCEVENAKGIVSAELKVSVCNDGEAHFEEKYGEISQICRNGSYYNISKSHNKDKEISFTTTPLPAFPTGVVDQQLKSVSSSSATAVLGGLFGVLLIVVIILAVVLVTMLIKRRKNNRYLVPCRNPASNTYNLPAQEDIQTDTSVTAYLVQNPVIRTDLLDPAGGMQQVTQSCAASGQYYDVYKDERNSGRSLSLY